MIISICGKSGSGKSTLSNELKEIYGDKVIVCDIDNIGHNVYFIPEVIEELVKNFGKNIIIDKNVDRNKLGELVFNSRKQMNKLTDITWKYMEEEIDKIIEENQEKIIILDWILIPQTKYFDMCDIKILLDVSYEIRKERAIKRDNISSEKFDLRDKASIVYDKDKFDFVLKDSNEIRKLVKLL